jgi:hypothetical protein
MANTYDLIASVTVGSGGTSTITFSSIPGTYTDLVIKTSLRDTVASIANAGMRVIFNNSSTGYSRRTLYGNGTTVISDMETSVSWARVGQQPGANATANTFSSDEVYIPNFTISNGKSLGGDSVSENNATEAYTNIVAGYWANSATVTSISLQSNSAAWTQNSTAYLYGIKKS